MKKSFRNLAEEYRDKVYTFAHYSLNNREDAEDVTQEVLVKLWRNVDKIDSEKLTAWVMRVARNAVIDATRRLRTRSSVVTGGAEYDLAENVVAARGADTEKLLRTRELQESVEEALSTVEEPYRSIVVMREIQDMTYAEIAATMETPLNTVKVYLHRGRAMLRAAMRGKT